MSERVRGIVGECAEIDPGEISETSSFRDEHDIDSLTVIEIVSTIEQEFGVVLADEQILRMVDLATACEVLREARRVQVADPASR